ncbi:MAG TPA: hypothetical protein VKB08_13400 [Bradyrhizobium sp.]|nr:hypothetical protein [Bradyrhizobium sp.]
MAFHHQGSPGDHSFRRGVFYLTDRPADVGAAAAGRDRHSTGNLAGFVGPFAMGWIKDHSGSYAASPWESC